MIALVSDDDGEELTLTFTEASEGEEFNPIGEIPEGQREPGPGGGFALSIPLEDEGGAEAGFLNAICIIVDEGGNAECLGTADLPDGQLVLNVTGLLEDDVSGSIIGGAGDYSGAYGTSESISQNDTSTDTFEFTVP